MDEARFVAALGFEPSLGLDDAVAAPAEVPTEDPCALNWRTVLLFETEEETEDKKLDPPFDDAYWDSKEALAPYVCSVPIALLYFCDGFVAATVTAALAAAGVAASVFGLDVRVGIADFFCAVKLEYP